MQIADTQTLARRAIDAAADKKAENLILLDLRDLSMVADYFVICSGATDRQLRAISDNIEETLRLELKTRPHHIEGADNTGWVLLDYGDLMVHVLSPSLRAKYNLEGLWSQAPVLLRMQ